MNKNTRDLVFVLMVAGLGGAIIASVISIIFPTWIWILACMIWGWYAPAICLKMKWIDNIPYIGKDKM